jgi:predicted extracellular nuclease
MISLSSCALIEHHIHQSKPLASEISRPKTQSDMSLVHLYRAGNIHAANVGDVNIYANEEFIFGARNNGYTWVYLKPGQYTFKAEWSMMDKPLFESGLYDSKNITLTVKENKQYYINYRVNEVGPSNYDKASQVVGIAAKIAEPRSPKSSVELVQEQEGIARSNIEKCRVQANELNETI